MKIVKTEITDCRQCPYSRWDVGKQQWQLLCTKFNGFIVKEGQEYPPPSTCQLDDAERLEQLSALQGCYIIRSEDIEAMLLTRVVDQLNDTEFLKKIIDVLKTLF